jgi:hypothetical protein
MLSSVLRSNRAIRVNIDIRRAFVRLRQILASHVVLARKLSELEKSTCRTSRAASRCRERQRANAFRQFRLATRLQWAGIVATPETTHGVAVAGGYACVAESGPGSFRSRGSRLSLTFQLMAP